MTDLQRLTPFLMFQTGLAQEAMDFYTELFDGEILMVDRYGDDTPDMVGQIRLAAFSVGGQQINIMDSTIKHEFDFTPSLSLYYRCSSESEFQRIWDGLIEDGTVLMPEADYGFGLFGWLNDRYGVSWQLSVETAESGETGRAESGETAPEVPEAEGSDIQDFGAPDISR